MSLLIFLLVKITNSWSFYSLSGKRYENTFLPPKTWNEGKGTNALDYLSIIVWLSEGEHRSKYGGSTALSVANLVPSLSHIPRCEKQLGCLSVISCYLSWCLPDSGI